MGCKGGAEIASCVLVDYREGLSIRSAGYKWCSVEKMACSWRSWKYSAPFGCSATFSWPLMSLRTKTLRTRPKTSAWRWLLVACFSSVKNHNVSGPHLLPSFTTQPKKNLCHPRTVLQRAKKSLCNRSQFRTLLLPHRFIKVRPSHQRPVSIEFLTICRFYQVSAAGLC